MSIAYFNNKNIPLLTVEMNGEKVVGIKEIINPELLPFPLLRDQSAEAVNQWIAKRRMPDKREGLKELRLRYPGFERPHHMFSLSDHYWFQYKKTEKWEQLSPFLNSYPTDVGALFFEPWTVKNPEKTAEGPDLMTNGILKKRWIQSPDMNSYLYKAGSKKYRQEPLSEVLASMTLEKLGIIDYVPYELDITGVTMCSRCRNFVNINTEYVPAAQVYFKEPRDPEKESVPQHIVRMAEEEGVKRASHFIKIFCAVNIIIGNTDPNLGNFGFLRDTTTGKIKGFAPLFDFGAAYFPEGINPDDIKDKTSMMFTTEDKRQAIAYIEPLINSSSAFDGNTMHDLTDQYPYLSSEQREGIHKCIKARCDDMKKLIKLHEKNKNKRYLAHSVR